jgi:prepilin-type N-terminal cleavage/methylation domain-containing protein
VSYLQERRPNKLERGDEVKALELPGRRVTMSRTVSEHMLDLKRGRRGFTLIELIITITVLTILTLGVLPLLKLSVKRQKEEQLHAALRQMRTAIDEFHRDTVGMTCTGVGTGTGTGTGGAGGTGGTGGTGGAGGSGYIDPRSKVVISDCTVFGVDNPDRYPPDLETLVSGVNVIPRAGFGGGRGDLGVDATKVGELSTKKKVYLRSIPINPFTGGNKIGTDWEFRSCYDDADAGSWGGENVFDVLFPPGKDHDFKPLREDEKYSEW